MKIKIFNAKILESYNSKIFLGEIVVENDKIIYIGKKYNGECEKNIDAEQNLVMPGLINCHTHSPMTFLKGFGEDTTLETWLEKYMFPLEETETFDDIYYGSMLAIAEFVRGGITTFADNYYYTRATAKACEKAGMRAVLSISPNLTPYKLQTREDMEKEFEELSKIPLIKCNFYCHATYTCDEALYANVEFLAKKYKTFNGTHASETLTEVGNCTIKNNGKTPIGLLESYGFFDNPSLLAHCVHLDEKDYEILSKYNVSVVHNPSSNLKLASGIAPVNAMLKRNINVCLGTDGSASNNRLDMFREMYLTAVLQKEQLKNPTVLPCETVIKIATINGAKALGLEKLGELKVGNYADLIMVNMNSINNCSCCDEKSALVYSSGTEDVLLTIVNGKILYYKGEYFIGENIEKIKEQCKLIVERFKKIVKD